MSNTPQTNVVGIFNNAAAAAAAVDGLHSAGFDKDKIGVAPLEERTMISVEADGRHAEAAAHLKDNGASGVQNVAR